MRIQVDRSLVPARYPDLITTSERGKLYHHQGPSVRRFSRIDLMPSSESSYAFNRLLRVERVSRSPVRVHPPVVALSLGGLRFMLPKGSDVPGKLTAEPLSGRRKIFLISLQYHWRFSPKPRVFLIFVASLFQKLTTFAASCTTSPHYMSEEDRPVDRSYCHGMSPWLDFANNPRPYFHVGAMEIWTPRASREAVSFHEQRVEEQHPNREDEATPADPTDPLIAPRLQETIPLTL